jgi:tetratricopeptide (TPR) repeat protein
MKKTMLQILSAIALAIFLLIVSAPAQTEKDRAQTANQVVSLNDRGVEAGENGKLEEAVKLYQAAIRLRSDYGIAHGNLGLAFYKMKQFGEAIPALKKALYSRASSLFDGYSEYTANTQQ